MILMTLRFLIHFLIQFEGETRVVLCFSACVCVSLCVCVCIHVYVYVYVTDYIPNERRHEAVALCVCCVDCVGTDRVL